jgi:hypothetical protein
VHNDITPCRSESRLNFEPAARRFRPDAERLTALGYEAIAHVPVLFSWDGRYLREYNWFLRERARLRWPPGREPERQRVLGRRISYPCYKTLAKIADNLVNFLGWLRQTGHDWRSVKFEPHLREYGDDQACGRWSRDGLGLDPGTVNDRIDSVTEFLSWAGHRNLRDQFEFPAISYRRRFSTGTSSTAGVRNGTRRAGKRRRKPMNLRLPELSELRSWLADVRRKRGYVKALTCRTILATGIRRLEASLLPLDFLPMLRSEWQVSSAGTVQFLLTDGTKFGKHRYVTIPLSLAEELHLYRVTERVQSLKKWIKNNPKDATTNKPRTLFLGDYDGTPISSATIYDTWTSARIYRGWSPHLGRHTWACYTLLDHLKLEAEREGMAIGSVPVTWIESRTSTLISLFVQPALGHLDEQTTKIYLQWLYAQFALPGTFNAWHSFLEADSDEQ